jgi:AP-4 complex subunit mu-1
LVIELLIRLTKVFKDYCGVLTEESIRSNFSLVYELLEEIIDWGYPQSTSTELMKSFVFNEPIIVQQSKSSIKLDFISNKTTPSTSVDKPISVKDKGKSKNEIFVDLYERLNLTFNSNGYILNSSIDGTIQLKSYLAGNPELRLALNEDLVIGKGTSKAGNGFSVLELDDCNFHECAKLQDFETSRILSFVPPDGEFTLMNYRITSDYRAPFRIFPFFELLNPHKAEVMVKVRCDIPENHYGANVVIQFPLPKNTSSIVSEMTTPQGQAVEYDEKERMLRWKIKKFSGNAEHTVRVKVTLSSASTAAVKKEIGPISMNFEIPMYTPSGLQVRYLRILENKNYNPYRWVRYVTRASSYICRL